MEKDYLPSEKYSSDEIESLQIPYGLQDSCVDSLVTTEHARSNPGGTSCHFSITLGPADSFTTAGSSVKAIVNSKLKSVVAATSSYWKRKLAKMKASSSSQKCKTMIETTGCRCKAREK